MIFAGLQLDSHHLGDRLPCNYLSDAKSFILFFPFKTYTQITHLNFFLSITPLLAPLFSQQYLITDPQDPRW